MRKLIDDIKKNEGFVGTVYKDSLGFNTIGYGSLLPISETEATLILVSRLNEKVSEIEKKEPFIKSLPIEKQEIIYEMCYQMGVSGVLKFIKMWDALKIFDYNEASRQMLDSRWAQQTSNRARMLAEKMEQ